MALSLKQLTPLATVTLLSLVHACSTATEPEATVALAFTPASLELGDERETTVRLENIGPAALGPIRLVAGVVTRDGALVPEAELEVVPAEIPTLNPGSGATIALRIALDEPAPAGSYSVSLEARVQGTPAGRLSLSFSISPIQVPGGTLAITDGPTSLRQGDVAAYGAELRDSTGVLIEDAPIAWSVLPASAGLVTSDARFVGYTPGTARIVARVSDLADTLEISIGDRGVSGGPSRFAVVGRGSVSSRFTSDLWLHGDFAYTGTWNCRAGSCGNRLNVWDVSVPASPQLSD